MKELDDLVQTINRLLAPDGCPWDREQTLQSMRSSLVEETYEVIEAIDLDHTEQLKEELGDLFFNVVFLCKLAEKERLFTLGEVLKQVVAKLVRRHPHIFGEVKLNSSQEVLKQWEAIKTEEKKQKSSYVLDGIPKDLPSLARAQKMVKKLAADQDFKVEAPSGSLSAEEQAGEFLWHSIQDLSKQGIHAEQALRKRLTQIEADYKKHKEKK